VQETAEVVGVLVVFAILLTRADYGLVRSRIRERLVPVGVPLGVMGLVVILFWATRPNPPPPSVVDGVYSNPCCATVVLRNGWLTTNNLRMPFNLRLMKYGLDADAGALEVQGGQVVVSSRSDCDVIHFSEDRRSFSIPPHPCDKGGGIDFSKT
jgi:hypothetical protein